MKRKLLKLIFGLAISALTAFGAGAHNIKGRIIDAGDNAPLAGATVEVEGMSPVGICDIDGYFEIEGLPEGKYTLLVNYISYKSLKLGNIASPYPGMLEIRMEMDTEMLAAGAVSGVKRSDTEIATVQAGKFSSVIVSNISSQEIARSQDSNASEVVKRIPGVSVIEDKFVMVRGLSQRYNNVWINGGGVPSSEADSRAFSFDIIPSSQIDNLEIVKVPAPEYLSDYSGGFILINTKEIPEKNAFSLSIGTSVNDASAFRDFITYGRQPLDFLGFGAGSRSIKGGFFAEMPRTDNKISLSQSGLSNDWSTRSLKPLGDLKLSASLSRSWKVRGHRMGLTALAAYSNDYRTYLDMQNNLFGVYNKKDGESTVLRNSVDDQYGNNVRLSGMVNFTLLSKNGNHKYRFKNIFNQAGTDRYTFRRGVNPQSDREESAEYYYQSRSIASSQITGTHSFGKNTLDWKTGFSYSNRLLPDRRRYVVSDIKTSSSSEQRLGLLTGHNVNREWTKLDEYIVSQALNYSRDLQFGGWEPTFKAGLFGEYRTRQYFTREFTYNWDAENSLPEGFQFMDMQELLSNSANFGPDRLYLSESPKMTNSYGGKNYLETAYVAAKLPFGKFSAYLGLRYEYDLMELISNTNDYYISPNSDFYPGSDFFPSINLTYKFNEAHQLRASYGKSINRGEFRERSFSTFYDFDLASFVKGNFELRSCHIDNADLRYEYYPSNGEIVSVAAFYKYFDSPIEWTYTVEGGTDLQYSFMNALAANNYGIELDIRKDLSFMGLEGFRWSFNGALIKSRVLFEPGSAERDRPMQGQSPYLVNSGLFYTNKALKLNLSILYNRIGKRIIGVGRSLGVSSTGEKTDVPDSYEMPRDVLDISLSKAFGKHIELKLGLKDVLGQRVSYKQFEEFTDADGKPQTVEQTVRDYYPGRNFSFALTYIF